MRLPFDGSYPITQLFGQNLNTFYKQGGYMGHTGTDFGLPDGTPLFAACTGTVISVSSDIHRGEGVGILSDDQFTYNGHPCRLYVLCWHMKDGSISVKVGDKITEGTPIGLSNNTGQSTGPHLHLAVMPYAIDGVGILTSLGNGYGGYIDPLPYFPVAAPKRIVKFGSYGSDVVWLQKRLGVNPTSGLFWTKTLAAVKAFQAAHGLVADGVVGPLTWAALA